MTNAEIEKAKELKHKLDVAWKQVHEYGSELSIQGFSVRLQNCGYLPQAGGIQDGLFYNGTGKVKPSVKVTKTETIEL